MEKMHLFAAKVELFFWNHVASLCVQKENFIFNFIFRTGNVQIKDFFHSSFSGFAKFPFGDQFAHFPCVQHSDLEPKLKHLQSAILTIHCREQTSSNQLALLCPVIAH